MRHAKLWLTMIAVVAASCGGDADTAEQAEAPAMDTSTATTTDAELMLPPSNVDVRSIDATLAEWSITLSQDSVSAGVIAFNVRNAGSVVHRFEVEGNGEEWESEDIAPGGDVKMSLSLSPGEYKVYCPIDPNGTSHEDRGMVTTLRVR